MFSPISSNRLIPSRTSISFVGKICTRYSMQYILKTEYRGSRTESATCLTVICRPALRPTAMDTSRITMNSAILVAATSRIYWS